MYFIQNGGKRIGTYFNRRTSIEESAQIDGARHFIILTRIYLPLSLPVMATITLFYAVGYWNAVFNAIIFLNKQDYQPVQVILREVLI